jgi:hypothetical protein
MKLLSDPAGRIVFPGHGALLGDAVRAGRSD